MRYALVLLSTFLLTCLTACVLHAQDVGNDHPHLSGGYSEAVFSVSDIDAAVQFYTTVAGWKQIHDGPMAPEILNAYELAEEAGANEIVLVNAGNDRGYLRLVQFYGVEQQQIRSNAQSWDTGGIFDVNVRVLNMDKKFAQFQASHWQAASDPVQFSFGPFVVKEWLTRGPDGVVLALIERVQPPLEGWPNLRELSRLFNATQIVSDIEAALSFYVDKLGFRVYLEHTAPSDEPGPNVLGLPHNLTTEIPRSVFIVHPNGTNEGSVELLAYEGASGSDFSARAAPPNLGILMLRFPLIDIDEFAAHIESQEIEVAIVPTRTKLAPYGDVRMMAIRGPGGVWLEFFEALN